MASGFGDRPDSMGDAYVPGDGDATGVMPPVMGQQSGLGGADPKNAGDSKGRRGLIEAYWVLFRFLYGGQLVDPCLIIAGDYLARGSVSERFV
ncbi:hypothetical protein [uncultured Varibaculum sp.]|uniref:hypothetical protein n=1 Tax=uncultured Varibaculum sp. TaxID=413896 RepID=UPI00288B16EB|nr:hypothetical protein [uncultured Varibaculum sp.]